MTRTRLPRRTPLAAGGRGIFLPVLCAAAVALGACAGPMPGSQAPAPEPPILQTRVTIESDGWRLVGDLTMPASEGSADAAAPPRRVAAALLLNKAAGNRAVYGDLARELAARGVGSLRLDLRGHGESVNLGRFQAPFDDAALALIRGTENDIAAGYRFLRAEAGVDPDRLGAVGASYSGELAVVAARSEPPPRAWVFLSPGSLSQESIAWLASSGSPWLFVRTHEERAPSMIPITEEVLAEHSSEVLILTGNQHGTIILEAHPALAEQIAVWLAAKLS